eukprot:CAMPEP_0119101636 /NCGR_PEP_ID=MMETSP1180-20130426/637_1 /TAXON_ID=3052 ORGANISM="Chlamydomonas cf sp, Strain CCMP681" /NCGR_SAMPLE_ID=MMETSP1180 /ASSEMBLY_ACC=CAM_ASM_000741 /LENGTH=243 /DNA_ID=CAMNT_0007085787 /DNA_START=115 /DNA_END=844 /DNA_ORIENTATION=+
MEARSAIVRGKGNKAFAAEEPAAAASTSSSWSEQEQQQLWSSVSRALMKMGKGGAKESHIHNLQNLLTQHGVVKVRHNGSPEDAALLAEQLGQAASVNLLGVQGRDILFGDGGLTREALLSGARDKATKIKAFHQKKIDVTTALEEAAADLASGPVQPSPNTPPPSSSSSPRKTSAPTPQRTGTPAVGKLDGLIRSSLIKGPLTRDTLKQEWGSISEKLYAEDVAAAEAEFQSTRSGRSAPWA